LLFSPLWLPFAWVFSRLSIKPDSFIIKRALILAASWALLDLILSSLLAWAVFDDASRTLYAAIPATVAALQLLLLFASAKAYFSQPRNRCDLFLLVPRLGGALVGASVLVISSFALSPKRAVVWMDDCETLEPAKIRRI
jgi:hypothetical protein